MTLGALPNNAPFLNGRTQVKRAVGDGAIDVNNTVPVGTPLQDGAGQPMRIAVTPARACHWLIQSDAMWMCVDGPAWQMLQMNLNLAPADLDGRDHFRLVFHVNPTVTWCSYPASTLFRLAGGTAYTCTMAFNYSSGYTQRYYVRADLLFIIGTLIGEAGEA